MLSIKSHCCLTKLRGNSNSLTLDNFTTFLLKKVIEQLKQQLWNHLIFQTLDNSESFKRPSIFKLKRVECAVFHLYCPREGLLNGGSITHISSLTSTIIKKGTMSSWKGGDGGQPSLQGITMVQWSGDHLYKWGL